jgi:hypothetical protein
VHKCHGADRGGIDGFRRTSAPPPFLSRTADGILVPSSTSIPSGQLPGPSDTHGFASKSSSLCCDARHRNRLGVKDSKFSDRFLLQPANLHTFRFIQDLTHPGTNRRRKSRRAKAPRTGTPASGIHRGCNPCCRLILSDHQIISRVVVKSTAPKVISTASRTAFGGDLPSQATSNFPSCNIPQSEARPAPAPWEVGDGLKSRVRSYYLYAIASVRRGGSLSSLPAKFGCGSTL